MRQRDTRVRLKHYYNDFYYVWVFVNSSFIFLAICGLILLCSYLSRFVLWFLYGTKIIIMVFKSLGVVLLMLMI